MNSVLIEITRRLAEIEAWRDRAQCGDGGSLHYLDTPVEVLDTGEVTERAWTDLDLSAYAPAGGIVYLNVSLFWYSSAGQSTLMRFRKNGSTQDNDALCTVVLNPSHLSQNSSTVIVATDTAGVIETMIQALSDGSSVGAKVSILAYTVYPG